MQTLRDKDFSDADFAGVWSAVAKAFSADRLLNSVLVAVKPERKSPTRFAVATGTEMQAEIVRKALPDVLAKLRDGLENDEVEIEVTVCEGDIPPRFWTEQQVLEHLLKSSPAVAEMISKYKMRLI